MTTTRDSFASSETRDLLAGLDFHGAENGELPLDGIGSELQEAENHLNDSEADNLSFIVSARFSRIDDCMTALESETSDVNYADLAEKVATRLTEISARLDAAPHTDAEGRDAPDAP